MGRDEASRECAGFGGLWAFRAVHALWLLLCPQKPHSPPHNPNRAHALSKKIRDFWGILGRLSRRIGEGGMREEQGSDAAVVTPNRGRLSPVIDFPAPISYLYPSPTSPMALYITQTGPMPSCARSESSGAFWGCWEGGYMALRKTKLRANLLAFDSRGRLISTLSISFTALISSPSPTSPHPPTQSKQGPCPLTKDQRVLGHSGAFERVDR
jgi:hypothetical protein